MEENLAEYVDGSFDTAVHELAREADVNPFNMKKDNIKVGDLTLYGALKGMYLSGMMQFGNMKYQKNEDPDQLRDAIDEFVQSDLLAEGSLQYQIQECFEENIGHLAGRSRVRADKIKDSSYKLGKSMTLYESLKWMYAKGMLRQGKMLFSEKKCPAKLYEVLKSYEI
jgi:hypothetical protein